MGGRIVTTNNNAGVRSVYAFDSVEEFLAHAYSLELEVAERYEEIADSMETHNNIEVADVFRELAVQSQKHGSEILAKSERKILPRIAPWDFRWGDGEAPETPPMAETHYLMTPFHALTMAREAESRARDFYARVAQDSAVEAIQEMAAEFSQEESEHVATLDRWLKKYPEPPKDWDFDPDPPGMPA